MASYVASNMKWKVLASRSLIKDQWIDLQADRCQLPNGVVVDPFYIFKYPDWTNAVALTTSGQVILTRQYRHGIGSTILELPGGTVDESDNSPEEAIIRELLEETGFTFESIHSTAVVSSNPDKLNNLVHCFLAVGGKKVKEPNPGISEQIEVELVSIKEFKRLLRENAFLQSLHIASAYYALVHFDRFFGIFDP